MLYQFTEESGGALGFDSQRGPRATAPRRLRDKCTKAKYQRRHKEDFPRSVKIPQERWSRGANFRQELNQGVGISVELTSDHLLLPLLPMKAPLWVTADFLIQLPANALGEEQRWPKCLGPCHSLAPSTWSSSLMASFWPSPDLLGHLGSDPVEVLWNKSMFLKKELKMRK